MNREQKAAAIDEVAEEIRTAQAVFAVDFRGISVQQSATLRGRLADADARFRVVKNRLTIRSADQAGAEPLKPLLEGPTALAFVRGDAALAAKALADFGRETQLLAFKGGTMNGGALTAEEIGSIARLPARDVLFGQLVGVTASPLTGLVRGLNSMIAGLASQLQQVADQGLVGGGAPAAEETAPKQEPEADETPSAGEETEKER